MEINKGGEGSRVGRSASWMRQAITQSEEEQEILEGLELLKSLLDEKSFSQQYSSQMTALQREMQSREPSLRPAVSFVPFTSFKLH